MKWTKWANGLLCAGVVATQVDLALYLVGDRTNEPEQPDVIVTARTATATAEVTMTFPATGYEAPAVETKPRPAFAKRKA